MIVLILVVIRKYTGFGIQYVWMTNPFPIYTCELAQRELCAERKICVPGKPVANLSKSSQAVSFFGICAADRQERDISQQVRILLYFYTGFHMAASNKVTEFKICFHS